MPKPTASSSNDVEINQIALSAAEFQNVARSWLNDALGPPGKSVADDGEPEEVEPELHADLEGVGFVTPKGDPSARRQDSSTIENLRRQMLGKRARGAERYGNQTGVNRLTAPKPRPRTVTKGPASDDEEEGRSRLGKKSKGQRQTNPGDQSGHKGQESAMQITSATVTDVAPTSKKGGTSYLNQVLAERAAKKKKKRSKAIKLTEEGYS